MQSFAQPFAQLLFYQSIDITLNTYDVCLITNTT